MIRANGQGAHRRGRRGHRPRDLGPPRERRLRAARRDSRRDGSRAASLRATGRRRARPDASRPRRLAADRDRARRGDRHADPRRERARHRAGPRQGARARRRRLPRQAVRDAGARCPCASRRAARSSRAGGDPGRPDRGRGASPRPAGGAGLRRRSQREPHADGVPPALRARAGAGTRRDSRGADAAHLGSQAASSRPHGRRLRPQACARRSIGTRRPTRSSIHDTGSGTSSKRCRSSGSRARRGHALHQSRALLARLQRARARPRRRRVGAAARADQVLLDLLVEPRRVLHGARRRPRRARVRRDPAALSRRAFAPAGPARDPRAGLRARHSAGSPLGPRPEARPRRGRDRGRQASRSAPTRSAPSSPRASSARSIPS